MTDPVPDTKPSTRWFWVAALAVLAVVLIIFVFNADGDETDFDVTDADITTTEERLNTDLGTQTDLEEAREQVNGADEDTVLTDEAEPIEAPEPFAPIEE